MGIGLSKRLKAIISLCDKVDTIVDVGTDHGKVAITLANMKISDHVIATDIKDGPLDMCVQNAKTYLNDDSSDFKTLLSDGLKNISKSTEIGVIIAGMGFDLISNIIKDINLYNYKYLIISPHTKFTEFIKLLDNMRLNIDKIMTVFEDDQCYFITKIIR